MSDQEVTKQADGDSKLGHVLIACGGTGGHLFPGIAVAEEWEARGGKATVLISEKKIDKLASEGHPHLEFVAMPAIAMPRPWSPKMISFLLKFWKGVKACKKLVREKGTSVVLGMGGFTSTAPLYAGKKMKCKTLIHESNAIPGKANKLNARFSNTVLVGWEACKKHFNHNNIQVVGTPIRSALRVEVDRAKALDHFGLEEGRKTLLIMGGSQGAQGVNRAVVAALPKLKEEIGNLQVIHLAGPDGFEETKEGYAGADVPHHVAPFCHEMDLAYAIADAGVARSGASSLTELAYFGIPSVLVPYPFAAGDHQTLNARIYSDAGAAFLAPQDTLDGEKLAELLAKTLGTEAESMAGALEEFSPRKAASKICNLFEKL